MSIKVREYRLRVGVHVHNNNVVYDQATVLHAKYRVYVDRVYVPGFSLVCSAVGSKTSVPTITTMPIVLLITI